MKHDIFVWVQGALGFALGKLTWDVCKRIRMRRRYPYRWKCPICQFELKTNNRETFEISKSSHNHSRLREYKKR